MQGQKKHLVHVFPSFELGGTELRACRMINNLGSQFRHTIIAMDKNTECMSWIDPGIEAECLSPPEAGNYISFIISLKKMLKGLAPDILLTYNWGSIDSVFAAKLVGIKHILHIVGGFNPDEAQRQKTRRVLARRILLRNISGVVVKSKRCFDIAKNIWRIPEKTIRYIPNGIECRPIDAQEVSRIKQRLGLDGCQGVIGTAAAMTEVKNLQLLIRSFAAVAKDKDIRLVIAGEGPQRRFLSELAKELGVAEKVKFAGIVRNIADHIAVFDIFALSSKTEQMPNAVMEGMCAGLAVVSTDVGDVKDMVCDANKKFIVAPDDEKAFSGALLYLLEHEEERKALGEENRKKVSQAYPLKKCVDSYKKLFDEVIAK